MLFGAQDIKRYGNRKISSHILNSNNKISFFFQNYSYSKSLNSESTSEGAFFKSHLLWVLGTILL